MEQRIYEICFLISPDLTQSEIEASAKKIEEFIARDGQLEKTEPPKRIKLSYPIEEKKEAFLISWKLKMAPEKTDGLKTEIEKDKNILRYLLIKTKIKEEKTNKAKKPEEIEKKVGLEEVEKIIEKIR